MFFTYKSAVYQRACLKFCGGKFLFFVFLRRFLPGKSMPWSWFWADCPTDHHSEDWNFPSIFIAQRSEECVCAFDFYTTPREEWSQPASLTVREPGPYKKRHWSRIYFACSHVKFLGHPGSTFKEFVMDFLKVGLLNIWEGNHDC